MRLTLLMGDAVGGAAPGGDPIGSIAMAWHGGDGKRGGSTPVAQTKEASKAPWPTPASTKRARNPVPGPGLLETETQRERTHAVRDGSREHAEHKCVGGTGCAPSSRSSWGCWRQVCCCRCRARGKAKRRARCCSGWAWKCAAKRRTSSVRPSSVRRSTAASPVTDVVWD